MISSLVQLYNANFYKISVWFLYDPIVVVHGSLRQGNAKLCWYTISVLSSQYLQPTITQIDYKNKKIKSIDKSLHS